MTLVAELILYGGHLSPNLQARFFKLYPASSFWLDCQQLQSIRRIPVKGHHDMSLWDVCVLLWEIDSVAIYLDASGHMIKVCACMWVIVHLGMWVCNMCIWMCVYDLEFVSISVNCATFSHCVFLPFLLHIKLAAANITWAGKSGL